MVDLIIPYAILAIAALAALFSMISFLRAMVHLIFAQRHHDTGSVKWYAVMAVIFGLFFALLVCWIVLHRP